jgi:hypothetical protein
MRTDRTSIILAGDAVGRYSDIISAVVLWVTCQQPEEYMALENPGKLEHRLYRG